MTKRVLGVLVIGLGMAQPAAGQTIEGRWKIVATEDLKADGSVGRNPWGKAPVGSVVVQDGACYLQILASEVPSFPKGETSTVEQMKASLFTNYISYTGPCTYDTKTGKVDLKVERAYRPDYAVDQVRYARAVGDTLFFGPTERVMTDPPWSGVQDGQLTRRLRLVRVK